MKNTHEADTNMKDKNVTLVMFSKHDFPEIQKILLQKQPNYSDYATNKKDDANVELAFGTAGPVYTIVFPHCYQDLCFAAFLTKPHNCDFDYDSFIKSINIDPLVVINKSLDGDKKVIYYNDQINEFSGSDYVSPGHIPSNDFDNALKSLLALKKIIDGEVEMYRTGKCRKIRK